MDRIRAMAPADACRVAELHHAAMGRSLWARLGRPFLAALYGGLIRSRHFIGFVYHEDGRVRGFIAGSPDSRKLYRDVLLRDGWRLIFPAMLGVVRDPSLVLPLLSTPQYFSRSQADVDVPAESLFCSFEPDLRGKRISGHINKVLFDELLYRGVQQVKITTELDNEGAVRQLESWGFVRQGAFHFYGKDMALYLLDLVACDRVEPVSRHVNRS